MTSVQYKYGFDIFSKYKITQITNNDYLVSMNDGSSNYVIDKEAYNNIMYILGDHSSNLKFPTKESALQF